jgi:LPXTG-motif cell wall-anchored protein
MVIDGARCNMQRFCCCNETPSLLVPTKEIMRKTSKTVVLVLSLLAWLFFANSASAQADNTQSPQSDFMVCVPAATGSNASTSSDGVVTFNLVNDTCKPQAYKIAEYVPLTSDKGDWWGLPNQGQSLRSLSDVRILPVGSSVVVVKVDPCERVQVDLLLGNNPDAPAVIHPLGAYHGPLLTGIDVNSGAVQFTPSADCAPITTTTTSTTSTTTTSTTSTTTSTLPVVTSTTILVPTTVPVDIHTPLQLESTPVDANKVTSKLAYTGISDFLLIIAIGLILLGLCAIAYSRRKKVA